MTVVIVLVDSLHDVDGLTVETIVYRMLNCPEWLVDAETPAVVLTPIVSVWRDVEWPCSIFGVSTGWVVEFKEMSMVVCLFGGTADGGGDDD